MPLHIRGEKTATTHHPRLSDRRKPSLLMLMMTMVVVFGLLSVSWMQAVVINSAEENNRRIALKEKIKQFKGHTVKTTTTTSSSTGTTNEEEETGEEEAPPPFNIEQEQLAFFHTVKTILNGEYHSISTSVATSILVAACDYVIREAASLDAIQEEDIMQSRPVIDINCSNPDYELALTGETDSEDQKYIIDIVIFGFDVDYLEMRLAEHYDIVDKFLIIEQDHNLKGIPKPYFILDRLFNMTNNRFARYMDKIEVITQKLDSDIHGTKGWHVNGTDYYWDIEKEARAKPIQHLHQTLFVNNPTLCQDQVYVIQNDGDEIMTRKALSHFKQCQLHPNSESGIAALSIIFKLNVAWMEETYDMRNTRLSLSHQTFKKLRQVLWRLGPSLWRWRDVDQAGTTNRDMSNDQVHLGLGAANHFSSPLHPVLRFVKEISVVDAPKNVPIGILQKDNFTLQDITKSQLGIMCPKITNDRLMTYTFPIRHSSLFGKEHYDFIESALPWVVKLKPYRYPWLYTDGILQQQLDLATEVCGHVGFTTPVTTTN